MSPTTKACVLQTGQDECWDTWGNRVSATGSGQDAEFQRGKPSPAPRFVDNNDGSVSDKLTGLIWLKDADLFGEVPWADGLKLVGSLSSGSRGLSDGSSAGDWRVPNIREMLSLIDYGTSDPIIPAGHPFKNVKSAIYWTSTSLAPAPLLAWMMTLGIGPTVFDVKGGSNRVWPVRGLAGCVPQSGQKQCWDASGNPLASCSGSGQDGDVQAGVVPPSPRFTDNGDGTVTDNMTQLVWLKNGNPWGLRTWAEALALCNDLASGDSGLSDGSTAGQWRLPNVREIESLVDYNNFGPSIPNPNPFVNVRPSSYWTSTSVSAAPTEAMFIILGVGPSIFDSKEHQFFVWPVRDKA